MPTAYAVPPRSALLVAWGNAWLCGDASLDQLSARVGAHDDVGVVEGLDAPDGPLPALPVERALAQLRTQGVRRLRLVLPAPGDMLGMPAPGPFTAAALTASEGVLALTENGTGTGLVPTLTVHGSAFDGTVTTVRWSAAPVQSVGPDSGPFLHDAEHDLRIGLRECLVELTELDIARWRPEVAEALTDLRRDARRGIGDDELPGGYPARARELLVQARSLAAILMLAGGDEGGAVNTRESVRREQALQRLGSLVRHARIAGYNAYGLT